MNQQSHLKAGAIARDNTDRVFKNNTLKKNRINTQVVGNQNLQAACQSGNTAACTELASQTFGWDVGNMFQAFKTVG